MIDLIASENQGTFEAIAEQSTKDLLNDLVDSWPEKEAIVIRLRYGLEDRELRTL